MRDKIRDLKEKITGLKISSQRISKEKKILGGVFILLIGFLLYESLIAFQINKLKAIDFQFISQKRLLDFYSQLTKHTDVLVNEKKEKEKDFNRIKERFVNEEELSGYFSDLRAKIKSHNLKIISLDFKPQENIAESEGEALNYYRRLPIDLSVGGNYFNTMSFLYRFEQDNPIFHIKSISIKQENPDSYEVVAQIRAFIYISLKKN
jgi:Tfp pilus assembly protein PilO